MHYIKEQFFSSCIYQQSGAILCTRSSHDLAAFCFKLVIRIISLKATCNIRLSEKEIELEILYKSYIYINSPGKSIEGI